MKTIICIAIACMGILLGVNSLFQHSGGQFLAGVFLFAVGIILNEYFIHEDKIHEFIQLAIRDI